MLKVKFDPWSTTYKRPFGAAACDTTVQFAVEVEGPSLLLAMLVIYQEGDTAKRKIPLEESSGGFYIGSFNTGFKKGLYFYYFVFVTEEEDVLFAGKSKDSRKLVLQDGSDQFVPYQLTCYEETDKAPEWYQEAICYQIFPDRFFNDQPDGMPLAKKKNSFLYMDTADDPFYVRNGNNKVARWDFYGGNLSGILAKLDYLKELGINLIYLNPVFEARSNHRYDTADFMHVDPMLGTDEDFKHFIEVMHDNGIRVILDGVFNHVGQTSRYFNKDGSYDTLGAYQSKNSPYYPWFKFKNYPTEYQSWWGVIDLPEVDKENPDYQQFIYGEKDSVIEKWTRLGVDGWRLDVADELPDFFIEGIRQRLNQFPERVLIGEVWEDASNKVSYDERRKYILGDELHGVMNYPLKESILQLVNGGATPEQFAERGMTLRENYPKDIFFNNLNHLGTHDTERIFTLLGEDVRKLRLAVALLFCMPGIPCIYYGDEVGLTGGKDPDNRKFYPWGRENMEVLQVYREWLDLRQKAPILAAGEVYFGYSDHVLAVLRVSGEEFVALTVNLADETCSMVWRELNFMRPLPKKVWQRLKDEPTRNLPGRELSFERFSTAVDAGKVLWTNS